MKNSIAVHIFGRSGRMGQHVESIIKSQNSLDRAAKFQLVDDLSQAQVIIDFSSPEGLSQLVQQIRKLEKAQKAQGRARRIFALVSGTTGLTSAQFKELKSLSKTQAVLWASNFSPGLWIFRQSLKALSSAKGFEFSIDEIHHSAKKDNPSGTALTLKEDLEAITHQKIAQPYGQRIGGVVGIHTVSAASAFEMIRFEHMAMDRKVFAQGAVDAAKWLSQQSSGFYSMDDYMGDLS